MITDIIDVFCFIGNAIDSLAEFLNVIDLLCSIGRFFKWCASLISTPFSKLSIEREGH